MCDLADEIQEIVNVLLSEESCVQVSSKGVLVLEEKRDGDRGLELSLLKQRKETKRTPLARTKCCDDYACIQDNSSCVHHRYRRRYRAKRQVISLAWWSTLA